MEESIVVNVDTIILLPHLKQVAHNFKAAIKNAGALVNVLSVIGERAKKVFPHAIEMRITRIQFETGLQLRYPDAPQLPVAVFAKPDTVQAPLPEKSVPVEPETPPTPRKKVNVFKRPDRQIPMRPLTESPVSGTKRPAEEVVEVNVPPTPPAPAQDAETSAARTRPKVKLVPPSPAAPSLAKRSKVDVECEGCFYGSSSQRDHSCLGQGTPLL